MRSHLRFSLAALAIIGSMMLGFAGPLSADYQIVDVTDGGVVTGTATWKGELPRVPPLKVFADMDVCGDAVESPVLQIDPVSRGVRFVLVYLEKAERGKAPPEKYRLHMGRNESDPASRRCQFQEHVFPFVRTSEVAMINYEDILHNPHFFDEKRASLFNVAMPTPNREINKKMPRARGVGLRLQCDVHVHMNAWTAAFDHPYFTVTDAAGKFTLTDVPPGRYTLVAWHEGYNITGFASSRPSYDDPHVIRKEITLTAGETLSVNFEFPARDVEVEWKIAGED